VSAGADQPRRVVFRTRGNHRQGMGDLHGCLAMAREFQSRGSEVSFLAEPDPEAVAFCRDADIGLIAADGTRADAEALGRLSPDCLIVNMLKSDADYLSALLTHAGLLVTVDDDGPAAPLADLRINPLYPIPNSLTDPAFVPLKDAFQRLHDAPRDLRQPVRRLLVTLGGSDTFGFTPLAVRAMAGLPPEVHVEIVVGPAFTHQTQLEAALRTLAGHRCETAGNVCDMPDRILRADLAVCAGGLTLFEMACLGTPAVVICGEPFEEQTAAALAARGFGIDLGYGGDCIETDVAEAVASLIDDPNARERMGVRGRELVDGRGAHRCVEAVIDAWRAKGTPR